MMSSYRVDAGANREGCASSWYEQEGFIKAALRLNGTRVNRTRTYTWQNIAVPREFA